MSTEWHCAIREKMENKNIINPLEVNDHPLKSMTVTVLESRGTRKFGGSSSSSIGSSTLSLDPFLEGLDPLSQFAQESIDPLSQMVADYEATNKTKSQKAKSKIIDSPLAESIELPWSARRGAVLNKFTTSEKLSIVTSFLSGGEMIKKQTTVSDKVKYRLEQLDEFEEGSIRQMMDLTQQEYVIKIEQLNHELIQAWHGDQRVKALKIAIQCSKFLADTSVMQFYPSKFVLITDILDIFGKLVFDRLRTKSEYFEFGSKEPKILPENFTPEMVPDSAKETCLNWFYKIASIRELLPRLYVEIAILKSYSFLTNTELTHTLFRLTRMIRGIGDPLIAIYARCYLCRVAVGLTSEKEYIKENINDLLAVYHTMFSAGIKTEMARQRIEISTYLSLYVPAVDWIMQGISVRADDILLDDILAKCQDKKNNGLLLNSIMASFKSDYIASRAQQFVTILSNSVTEGITKSLLFRSLGQCLSLSPPPADKRVVIFEQVWSTVSTFTNPSEYISCAEMWAQFTGLHFHLKEINLFLGEIILHMTPKRAFEKHYHELQSIIDKIVTTKATELDSLLILDNFLPVLDLFQKETVKLDICKNIMNVFKNNIDMKTNDPVITNALMYICKVLNDSVNALTLEDERRQIGNLISHFIKNVDYGRDFEQQLNFYVDARAAFPNIDLVLSTLVHSVNKLAMDTRKIVRGQHSRKTVAFVKACAAYCFITIPSIVSVMTRMDLYLLSGQVALINVCLGQADACFEAALNIIPELPKTIEIDGKHKNTETYLVSYLCNFLSTLIIVPDSPDQGALYLTRLLLETFIKYPFDQSGNGPAMVYLHTLDMLSIAAQEIYPYHIPNVVSNDELYGSDPKFIMEIDKLCSQIVDNILANLKLLGDSNQIRIQATLSIELFIRIITGADITNDKMYLLASNLWSLAAKNKNNLDPKLLSKTVHFVENFRRKQKSSSQRRRFEELIGRMKSKI